MSELMCFLIGPNGSGKTTVGRMLANFLSLQFVDSDLEIENLSGEKIINICREKGIDAFSQFETTVLHTLTAKKNIVFATSVHSITKLENRHFFNMQGKTIYLAANPVNQYTRSMLSNRQPPMLLQAKNKLQYLIELAKTMDPLYNSIADFVVATDDCSIEEVVNKIIDYLYCGVYC